jgi:large subunit ribosomal protein L10
MLRSEKEAVVGEVRDRFQKMSSAVFVDFVGMTVEEVSRLRETFRKRGIEYRVVKNTLIKQALSEHSWVNKLDQALHGMTGVAWSFEEPSAAARIVKQFRAEFQKPVIKAGLLEGTVLDGRGVEEQLATLPSKDEARSLLLATMMAPAQNFVMLLNAPAQHMVGVLAAKQRKEDGA